MSLVGFTRDMGVSDNNKTNNSNISSNRITKAIPFPELSFGSNYRRRSDIAISVQEDDVEMDEGSVEQVSGDCWVRHPPRPKRRNKRFFLHFMNYDGLFWHGTRKHLIDCPKRSPDDEEAVTIDKDGEEEETLKDDQHDTKVGYALALTNVDPEHLVITWNAVHECDFRHRGCIPSVSKWNKYTSGAHVRAQQRQEGGSVADSNVAKADAYIFYKNVREYLATEFPVDSLLGTRHRSFTQQSLVDLILSTPYNSKKEEESDLGGFVLIEGGAEGDAEDGVKKESFGFVHQRSALHPERDIGQFTKYQMVLHHGGDREKAKKHLYRLAAVPGTMSRNSLAEGSQELWSLDLLRFMCHERRFHSFRIRHFVLFKNKHYLSPFITSLLQRRWDLRRENDPTATALLGSLLKLLPNGEHEH